MFMCNVTQNASFNNLFALSLYYFVLTEMGHKIRGHHLFWGGVGLILGLLRNCCVVFPRLNFLE